MRPRNNAAMQRYREEYHRCCGDLVRQLRTEKGWSLADFSRETGISVPWLRKFEENRLAAPKLIPDKMNLRGTHISV